MEDPPAAKRPRIEHEQQPSVPMAVPELSPEIIGRVASYSKVGDDLMNICLAVGPGDVGAIRFMYLRDNDYYLQHNLFALVDSRFRKREKVKENFLTWMGINEDWKKRCTAGNMDKYVDVWWYKKEGSAELIPVPEDNYDAEDKFLIHPYAIFNNPAVAMDVGLLNVLRFLVEEKKIDVNQYKWKGLFPTDERNHLIYHGIAHPPTSDFGCIEYLLSRETMDINLPVNDDEQDVTVFQSALMSNVSEARVLEALIRHCGIDVNAPILSHFAPLDLMIIFFANVSATDNMEPWLPKVKVLLDAGAHIHHGALTVARHEANNSPHHRVWKEIVELMENVPNRDE